MVRAARRALRRIAWARAAALAALLLFRDSPAATLPYRSQDRHLGVASCSSSVCHGSVQANGRYDVPLNEYVVWSHEDRHSQAYQVLTSDRARSIAAKLGLASATGSDVCLGCHTDNVPAARRGPAFALADGVGCEACHGGSERWIASHAVPGSSYRQRVAQGMYPTADLTERMQLCGSCHLGNADKFATHRIMGAGHPRLSFELDTFLAIEPPHYAIDADYRRRKTAPGHVQTWAMGQLAAARMQLQGLQDSYVAPGSQFPELAFFNCSACHDSSMQHPTWRRRAMTRTTEPGMVPLNDAHWTMSWLIARAIDDPNAARMLALGQQLHAAVPAGPPQVRDRAHALKGVIDRVFESAGTVAWESRGPQVAAMILDVGIDGEFRDYLGAEQAAMALELLLIESGAASRVRTQINEVYAVVSSEDEFRAEKFQAALRGLREAIRAPSH
jgi:hypothetical protein